MLIQLPIMFALYQVILFIPGYVNRVSTMFNGLAVKITEVSGYSKLLTNFVNENSIRVMGGDDYTDYEAKHFHKIATELTVIISGRVRMNGIEYGKQQYGYRYDK